MKPDQIRRLRERLGLTQAQFAERIGLQHKASVSRLESGTRTAKGPLLAALQMLAGKG
jgi:transcriptional regulator with XRE-family HTH domain